VSSAVLRPRSLDSVGGDRCQTYPHPSTHPILPGSGGRDRLRVRGKRTTYESPYMAMTLLTAILPLLGVLIGACLQYLFGRTLTDRKHLTLQKGQAYADYFGAMAMLSTQGRSKEALALATEAKTRICIYGSPSIIQQLGEFERAGARVTGGGQAVVTELLKAMRKDMGIARAMVQESDLRLILFGIPSTS
jgi:hypothetical protein